MSGGVIQLVSIGDQDVHLTSTPEISFFNSAYRRYTNFAVESIAQTFNGTVVADGRLSAAISRSGDLVCAMWLELTLPEVPGAASPTTTPVRPGGNVYDMIDRISVEVGGTVVDTHTGEWMRMLHELTVPHSQRRSLYGMTHWEEEVGWAYNRSRPMPPRTMRVPLSFWFCREPGKALPLIALQYHEVKVNVLFTEDVIPGTKAQLWCDYVFLDSAERRRFARNQHQYLIEQVQTTGEEPLPTFAGRTRKIRLNFNHPIKELLWTTHHKSGGERRKGVDTAKLVLNGTDRFAARDGTYFSVVQRFQHHSCSGDVYPGDSSEVEIPSANWQTLDAGTTVGVAPTSILNPGPGSDTASLDSVFGGVYVGTDQSVYDVSVEGPVLVELTDALVQMAAGEQEPKAHLVLSTLDLQTPDTTPADAYARFTGANYHQCHKMTVTHDGRVLLSDGTQSSLTAAGRLGIRFRDGAFETYVGDTVVETVAAANVSKSGLSASIWFSGVHRSHRTVSGTVSASPVLSEVKAHSVQVKQLRTIPAVDNSGLIYLYSFALDPEKYHPTGTCNFSRIDNANLEIKTAIANLSHTTIYGVNYNILRIKNGMGGIAYSN